MLGHNGRTYHLQDGLHSYWHHCYRSSYEKTYPILKVQTTNRGRRQLPQQNYQYRGFGNLQQAEYKSNLSLWNRTDIIKALSRIMTDNHLLYTGRLLNLQNHTSESNNLRNSGYSHSLQKAKVIKRVACKCLDTTDGEAVRKVVLIHIGITTVEVQTRRPTRRRKRRRPIITLGRQTAGITITVVTVTCSRQNQSNR